MSEGRSRLAVSELTAVRATGEVLGPLSFAVEAGETIGLIGPSDGGRTELLHLIAGSLRQRGGAILLDGAPLGSLSRRRRIREGVIAVRGSANGAGPAERGLRVVDHLGLAVQLSDLAVWRLLLQRRRRLSEAQHADIRAVLDFCGCPHLLIAEMASLAPVDARRVAIARALCQRPRLLLLHRPFVGLTAGECGVIGRLIARIAAEKVAVIVDDEQLALLETVCHRLLVLARGRQVAFGTVGEIAIDAAASRAFTGHGSAGATVSGTTDMALSG
ncbi:MAG: ATP-binding cassette domain-containing protein [Geminicoccaceae bacterium]|nr:ATP-binding cassette domain-containing protein [Geminicoccaceae bacterium]